MIRSTVVPLSRDEVKILLASSRLSVQHALVALYHEQTADERSSQTTQHSNGRGFNAHDARFGSNLARQVLQGATLTHKQIECGRKLVMHYVGQLSRLTATGLVLADCPRGVMNHDLDRHGLERMIVQHDPFQHKHYSL